MIKINIPTPLREHTQGKTVVETAGANVKSALDDLCKQFPALAAKLFDRGEVKPFLNVYLNDEDIRYLGKEQTPINDKDVLSIVPSIAGGIPIEDSTPTFRHTLRCICS
jgi:molybdopterin converting factor small subunit